MSRALPYYKMYPGDAETDENFRLMTLEQRGFYWTALNYSWINDGLPLDEAELRQLFGLSKTIFERVWVRVSKAFQSDGERFRNKRQEEERQEAISKSESAARAARSKSERSPNDPLRASGSGSNPDASGSGGKSPEKGEIACGADPLKVLAELGPIFESAGVPISEKHKQQIIQYLIDIPPDKLHRVPDYVKNQLLTGRWSSPRTTKTLLSLLQSGDWDVPLVARTLPQAPNGAGPPSKREAAHERAAAIFMKEGNS